MHPINLQKISKILKRLPFYDAVVSTTAWKSFRHRLAMHLDARENSTFTGFLRLPSQFEALCGPILDYILQGADHQGVEVAVMGCSNGAEAYTIASFIKKARPGLEFKIKAFDINQDILKKAEEAVYEHGEVFNNKRITTSFIEDTFNVEGNRFIVKGNLKSHVSFAAADALDRALPEIAGSFDIVFAQNFLFHLDRKHAGKATENIIRLLKPTAVIFIDGMDIDLRLKITRRHNLKPLVFKLEEIHNEARWARAVGWPYHYWCLEPYLTHHRDHERRYATIFLR